jgi:hypothetical protein
MTTRTCAVRRCSYHRFSDVSGLRRSPDVCGAFIRHDLAAIWGGRRTCWLRSPGTFSSPSKSHLEGSAPQIAPFKARGRPRATSIVLFDNSTSTSQVLYSKRATDRRDFVILLNKAAKD